MKTDYGKIAYLKTEEIIKNLDNTKNINRIVVFSFINTAVTYSTNLFTHNVLGASGSVVNLTVNLKLNATLQNEFVTKIFVNGIPVYKSTELKFEFNYVTSGNDTIDLQFEGTDADITVSQVTFTYVGYLKNIYNSNILFFDDISTGYVYIRNGTYYRFSNLTSIINAFTFVNPTTSYYSANSIPTSTRKTGYCGLYYDDATGYLTLKNFSTSITYTLKQVKPDFAIFFPISTAQYRIVYSLNSKLYFFYMSRNGSVVSEDTEIVGLDNLKITSIFPFNIITGNTVNYSAFGAIAQDGSTYIFKYNDSLDNYSSKKYIGKSEYASGYYDSSSVNVVLYNNGVATLKTYSDREVCNLTNTKEYYNCYRLFNIAGSLVSLNFNGLSIINT